MIYMVNMLGLSTSSYLVRTGRGALAQNVNWSATSGGCPNSQLRSLATGRVVTPLPPEGGATHCVISLLFLVDLTFSRFNLTPFYLLPRKEEGRPTQNVVRSPLTQVNRGSRGEIKSFQS